MKKTIESEGGQVLGGTPQEFAARLKADIPAWAAVVKESGAVVVGQPLQRAYQRALTAPGDPRRTRVNRQWITSSFGG